jgi:uncharacterized integral membrane protein
MVSETDEELLHQSNTPGPERGAMDIREHLRTWHGFLSFMKWQIILAVILLIILAVFRTHN